MKAKAEITKIMFGVGTNDAYVTIRFPCGESKIKGKYKKGDFVKIKIKKLKQ